MDNTPVTRASADVFTRTPASRLIRHNDLESDYCMLCNESIQRPSATVRLRQFIGYPQACAGLWWLGSFEHVLSPERENTDATVVESFLSPYAAPPVVLRDTTRRSSPSLWVWVSLSFKRAVLGTSGLWGTLKIRGNGLWSGPSSSLTTLCGCR